MAKGWKTLLKDCPTKPWKGPLYRFVAKNALDSGRPPNYLFTSGKRNRCNPEAIQCLYLAEDSDTALTEFKKYYSEVPPSVLYRINFQAQHILDLSKPATRKHLGITNQDLVASFRIFKKITPLESLGLTLSRQTKISAIKFPSAASKANKKRGYNLVVYKDALVDPDYLEVYDPENPAPNRWP